MQVSIKDDKIELFVSREEALNLIARLSESTEKAGRFGFHCSAREITVECKGEVTKSRIDICVTRYTGV